ncbi:hypothetical protein GCM10009835_44230 [Planosporangium flavigriseum]
MWADGGMGGSGLAGAGYIDITATELPALLHRAHADLLGFLRVLKAWADSLIPFCADALVDSLDRQIAITEQAGPNVSPQ